MGKRNRKSNSRARVRQKARNARVLSHDRATRQQAPGAPTLPISEADLALLQSEATTFLTPEALGEVAPDDVVTATRQLTLVEMLALQPEEAVLFHPCGGCGKPIRGEASHCEECSTAVEEAEALSREEKARHERRMSLVRKGVVVTVLVTIFGTYFWFNDPRKLLDGLLPGIFGPAQEADVSKIAHAEMLPSPSIRLEVAPSATGARGTAAPLVSPTTPATAAPNSPTRAVSPTSVVRQAAVMSPTVTSIPTARLSPTASPFVQQERTEPLATPTSAGQEALAMPSATPTSTVARPQPTATRTPARPTASRPSVATPTPTRVPPTALPRRSATPTRTRTPLPAPTSTPVPPRPTAVPVQPTVTAPASTPTPLVVLPTITPALPTLTSVLPTLTVPLPTVSVLPTEVRLPEPTVPTVPTVDVPSPPVPTVPLPTDVVPTVPAPTVPAPTVPEPTVPAPPTVAPTVVPPTVPVPSAPVPTEAASVVPTDVPAVPTPSVPVGLPAVPTATVLVPLP